MNSDGMSKSNPPKSFSSMRISRRGGELGSWITVGREKLVFRGVDAEEDGRWETWLGSRVLSACFGVDASEDRGRAEI